MTTEETIKHVRTFILTLSFKEAKPRLGECVQGIKQINKSRKCESFTIKFTFKCNTQPSFKHIPSQNIGDNF